MVGVDVAMADKAENQKTRLWPLLPEASMPAELRVHNEAYDSAVTSLRTDF